MSRRQTDATLARQGSRSEAVRLLWRHARPYLRLGAVGLVGTVLVVLARILMPWPLRGIIEAAFPDKGHAEWIERILPRAGEPVLWLCAAYLVLASFSGLSEYLQRVWLARFASHTVHDLRAAALAAVRRAGYTQDPGALVARIVGDSARVKSNLAGILIHGSQNGLLIAGITVLFLFIAPKLGVLFLFSGVAALSLGYLTLDEVTQTALKQRESESRFAREVQRDALAIDLETERALNTESSTRHVRTARLLSRAGLTSHVAVAATISLALWIGVRDVGRGTLAPGELFLFIAYALPLHRRAVRFGRQVARCGKVIANTQRLAALACLDGPAGRTVPANLHMALALEDVRVRSAPGHRGRHRLGPLDLVVPAGARVAVLGGVGSGKSSLLQVIAGRIAPHGGRVLWDGEDLTETPERLRWTVAFLAQELHLGAATIETLLGDVRGDQELLERLGAAQVLRRLDCSPAVVVDCSTLTQGQQRSLMLAHVVASSAPLWALDRPLDGSRRKERERLSALLDRAGDRTVIVALSRPCVLDEFTHVVVLRKGRVAFVGSPAEWRAWKSDPSTEKLSA